MRDYQLPDDNVVQDSVISLAIALAHAAEAQGFQAQGRIDRDLFRRLNASPHEHWLDERDARVPAPPDPRVQLVTKSGKIVGSTSESNLERMSAGPRTPLRPADGRPRLSAGRPKCPGRPGRPYRAEKPGLGRELPATLAPYRLLAPCATHAALMSRFGSSATTRALGHVVGDGRPDRLVRACCSCASAKRRGKAERSSATPRSRTRAETSASSSASVGQSSP
jgi:hypothetical protein